MLDPNAALLHSLGVMNLKPRDTAKIIATLKSDHGVEVQSENGLLTMTQNGTLVNPATVLTAYATKRPLDFYGLASNEIKYKTDLPDASAKVAYINQFGQKAWDSLPFNEKSPAAQHVVNATVPHAGMTAAQYKTLSVAERARLSGEIGAEGIERILARR